MGQYAALIKIGVYAAIVAAVYFAWQWDRNQQYKAGGDAKEVEMRANGAEVLTAVNKHYADQIAAAEKKAEEHRKRAAFLENQEPPTVTEYVDRFVENPLNADCIKLHGISELWNAAGNNYK
jgi:hypothetical protein